MPATKAIPVIFLTAIITKEEEEHQGPGVYPEAAKHRFIAKPFDAVSLLAEIKKTFNERP